MPVGEFQGLETLWWMEIGPFSILTYLERKAKPYSFVYMISGLLRGMISNELRTPGISHCVGETSVHETGKCAVICSQRQEDLERVGNLTPLVINLDA